MVNDMHAALRISGCNTSLCYSRRRSEFGFDTPLRYVVWDELTPVVERMNAMHNSTGFIRAESAISLFGGSLNLRSHVNYQRWPSYEGYPVNAVINEIGPNTITLGIVEGQVYNLPLCFPHIISGAPSLCVRYTQPPQSFNLCVIHSWSQEPRSRHLWDSRGVPDILFAPHSNETTIIENAQSSTPVDHEPDPIPAYMRRQGAHGQVAFQRRVGYPQPDPYAHQRFPIHRNPAPDVRRRRIQ